MAEHNEFGKKGKPQQPTSLQKKATPSFIVIGDVARKN
jgi:hypothetical protein